MYGKKWFTRWLGHALFIGASILLFTHQLPWIKNFLVIDSVQFSETSKAFRMYINLDKPFIGLMLFFIPGFGTDRYNLRTLRKVFWQVFPVCALSLLGLATLMGYVQWDPKIPSEFPIWMANNFLLVCVAEEAFFRRYLQGGFQTLLQKIRYGDYLALILASLLFGLAHFQGGINYVGLSALAGCFYGLCFLKTWRQYLA